MATLKEVRASKAKEVKQKFKLLRDARKKFQELEKEGKQKTFEYTKLKLKISERQPGGLWEDWYSAKEDLENGIPIPNRIRKEESMQIEAKQQSSKVAETKPSSYGVVRKARRKDGPSIHK